MNLSRGAGVTVGFVSLVAGLVTFLEWAGVEFAELREVVVGAAPTIIAIVLLAGAVVVAVALTVGRSSRPRTGRLAAIESAGLPAAPNRPPPVHQTRQGCVSIQVTISLGLVLLAGAALLRGGGTSNQSNAPLMSDQDVASRIPTMMVIAGTATPIAQPAGTPWGTWANADGTLVPENEPSVVVDAGCIGANSREDVVGVRPTCEGGPTT